MKLFSFYTGKSCSVGIRTEDEVLDLNKCLKVYSGSTGEKFSLPLDMKALIEQELYKKEVLLNLLESVKNSGREEECGIREEFEYDLLVKYPQKMLCVGRNYRAHAEEFGNVVPPAPFYFSKLPSSLNKHNGEIIIPKVEKGKIEHEIELAAIIGKKGKYIPEDKAFDYIAGFTVFNDITARDLQKVDMKEVIPWARSKSYDTFGPMGPYLVPKEFIENPQNLEMELKVNGKTFQKSNTAMMIYKINAVVSYISTYCTLLPGDVISTGTPEGTSAIKPGDRIEAAIEKLGTLTNTVVKEN